MQSYEINMTLFFSHIKNEFDRSKMKECISMCRLNDIILYSSIRFLVFLNDLDDQITKIT